MLNDLNSLVVCDDMRLEIEDPEGVNTCELLGVASVEGNRERSVELSCSSEKCSPNTHFL